MLMGVVEGGYRMRDLDQYDLQKNVEESEPCQGFLDSHCKRCQVMYTNEELL